MSRPHPDFLAHINGRFLLRRIRCNHWRARVDDFFSAAAHLRAMIMREIGRVLDRYDHRDAPLLPSSNAPSNHAQRCSFGISRMNIVIPPDCLIDVTIKLVAIPDKTGNRVGGASTNMYLNDVLFTGEGTDEGRKTSCSQLV